MKIIFSLMLILLVNFSFAQTKEVDSLYQIGFNEFKLGNFDEALFYFNKVVAIDSLNIKALEFSGRCYDRKFKTDLAIEYYEKTIKLDPYNYSVLFDLALNYRLKNQFEKSIDCYEKYIKLNPESEQGYFGLSFIYSTQNKYYESNIYAKEALKRIDVNNRGHYFAANYSIAISYYYLNQKNETKKIFIDLLSKDYNIPRQDILIELNLKNK